MATPTPDEIWKILKENAVQIHALEARQAETAKQMKGTDALIKANAVSQKETDKTVDKIGEQLSGLGDNIKETDKTVDKIGKQLGGLDNNIGDVCEEFFFRGSERTKQIAGIPVDDLLRNLVVPADVGGKQVATELDIVGVNGESAIVVEVKHKAHPNKVGELAAGKVAAMKRLYPDHKIYFALATMASNDALKEAARDAGVFLLTQGGENIKVVNDRVKAF